MSTYHMVLEVEENGSNVRSSRLYVNALDEARGEFILKIKELNPSVSEETLEFALDEGWYTSGDITILLIDPVVVIEKKCKK